MGIELVFVGFEGTLTERTRTNDLFLTCYKNSVASRLNLPRDEFDRRWDAAYKQVASDPHMHGWENHGVVVAPAYADTFIMARTVADIVLQQDQKFRSPKDREAELDDLFSKNHHKLPLELRPYALDFLCEARKTYPVCILTNSSTTILTRERPGAFGDVRMLGFASKHILNPKWEDVAVSVKPPNWRRDVYLRRHLYWQVLTSALRNIKPQHAVIVGDIYELDLALPLQCGMQGILLAGPATPDYELKAVETAQGYVVRSLEQALAQIRTFDTK